MHIVLIFHIFESVWVNLFVSSKQLHSKTWLLIAVLLIYMICPKKLLFGFGCAKNLRAISSYLSSETVA